APDEAMTHSSASDAGHLSPGTEGPCSQEPMMDGPQGIVNLSKIGLTHPQHTGFTTGRKPIILGVGQPSFR
ncbi:MAG: hypothetical protein ABGY72_05880, partial [bacterium]